MRRYIFHSILLLTTLLISDIMFGQTLLRNLNNGNSTVSKQIDITQSGNYYLDGDITMSGANGQFRIWGNSDTQVVIDLKGHTIYGAGRTVLNIARGTLTLIDTEGGGKIINSQKTCIYVSPSDKYKSIFHFKGGTIENCRPSNGEGGGVEVELKRTGDNEIAEFYMYDGAIIKGCTASEGAGVFVEGGKFVMYGGKIIENKIFSLTQENDSDWLINGSWTYPQTDADGYPEELPKGVSSKSLYTNASNKDALGHYEYKGGGVYIQSLVSSDNSHVTSYGSFTMYGGEISNNVSINGGGVYITEGCTFNFYGGTIKNNYSASSSESFKHGNGGGIYIYDKSNCTITSQTNPETNTIIPIIFKGNGATRYGGGIYVNGSSVTIDGVNIEGNISSGGGGLAQEGSNCSMNLNNCTVLKNKSLQAIVNTSNTNGVGAGVYIGNGEASNSNELKITNCNFSFNEAYKQGGGIYTGNNSIINMESGNFKDNAGTDGGGLFIQGGAINMNGNVSLTSNSASNGNGGGINLATGSFTVNDKGTISVSTNRAESGNGGGIYCAGTFTVEGTGRLTVGNNTAKNGGGVCIENGTILLPAGENSVISNNSATELGGGLYVVNSTSANFNGGKFSKNTAKSGGAVAAVNTTSGASTTLSLGAEMENNTASAGNGGGIYMNGGIHMTFGDGLIRLNRAESDGSNYTTADQKDHSSVQGVGGGIFMGSNCRLVFESSKMGIYNNYAENAGADICANGSGTTIELPDISNMTLKDWNIPTTTTGLYWVEDYFTGEIYGNNKTGIRYEAALNNPENDIYNYLVEGGNKYENYLCLDLGYDLVFVKITTEGLDANDDAAIQISYPRNEGATDTNLEHYRKVLFQGSETKIVGLPSGKWNFKLTQWSYKYEPNPKFDPEHGTNGFIDIANDNSSSGIDALKIIFKQKEVLRNIREYNHRVVNRMVPKTQSGN